MEFYETKQGIELPLNEELHLERTFDCGQCFRWDKREDGNFFGMAGGRCLTLREDPARGRICLEQVDREAFLQFWADYFDLNLDYPAILADFCDRDKTLAEAVRFAPGIRILRQDPWEALCSFIISQNNNIPRIRGIIQRLCENFGEKTAHGFRFPTAQAMAGLTVEDLAPLRSGFRAKYLLSAAQLVSNGQVDLEALYTAPLEEARLSLMQIQGVGPKVAECVLLYGLHRLEAFPMDVWMKRAMSVLFPGKSPADFGPYAGIAQQYIFHYSRQHLR